MRSEVGTGDQDEELEQPLVRARTAPAAFSDSPQLEQRSLVTGVEVGRTTSAEGESESQQPEAEPATPLEDAWMRRNPDGTPDPGIRLVGHLRVGPDQLQHPPWLTERDQGVEHMRKEMEVAAEKPRILQR